MKSRIAARLACGFALRHSYETMATASGCASCKSNCAYRGRPFDRCIDDSAQSVAHELQLHMSWFYSGTVPRSVVIGTVITIVVGLAITGDPRAPVSVGVRSRAGRVVPRRSDQYPERVVHVDAAAASFGAPGRLGSAELAPAG